MRDGRVHPGPKALVTSTRKDRNGITIRSATTGDWPGVVSLLHAGGLPEAGLSPKLDGFVVAEADGRLVGAVGLETYGPDALLRSAVVEPGCRGTGVGAALVEWLLRQADERGLQAVYLLTTTAEGWFPRFGFERITREDVPEAVRGSVEFSEACPASAAVMRRRS
jgi:amino-acid N-acetyltransferase